MMLILIMMIVLAYHKTPFVWDQVHRPENDQSSRILTSKLYNSIIILHCLYDPLRVLSFTLLKKSVTDQFFYQEIII